MYIYYSIFNEKENQDEYFKLELVKKGNGYRIKKYVIDLEKLREVVYENIQNQK